MTAYEHLRDRYDIKVLLELPDAKFQEWYETRAKATERLLNDYQAVKDIPNVDSASREIFDPTIEGIINQIIRGLENGRDSLEKIKKLREEERLPKFIPVKTV